MIQPMSFGHFKSIHKGTFDYDADYAILSTHN